MKDLKKMFLLMKHHMAHRMRNNASNVQHTSDIHSSIPPQYNQNTMMPVLMTIWVKDHLVNETTKIHSLKLDFRLKLPCVIRSPAYKDHEITVPWLVLTDKFHRILGFQLSPQHVTDQKCYANLLSPQDIGQTRWEVLLG